MATLDLDLGREDGPLDLDELANELEISVAAIRAAIAPGRPASRYTYVQAEDIYLWWTRAGSYVAHGRIVRAIRADYSAGRTAKAIATYYGWTKGQVDALRRALAWTHADPPVTVEAMEGYTDASARDQLVAGASAMFARQEAGGGVLEAAIGRVLADVITAPRERLPSWQGLEQGDHLVVSAAYDVHVGNGPYSETRDRLLAAADLLVDRAADFGAPAHVVVVIGGDYFHVDNVQKQTSKGTPQDLSMSPADMLKAGADLAVEYIDRWVGLGSTVEVRVLRGNHDSLAAAGLAWGLRAYFRSHAGVTVADVAHRCYLSHGPNLLGLEHGDGPKPSELPIIMAHEQAEQWATCPHRYWMTGHLHHTTEKDLGVTLFSVPTLVHSDAWHKKKGYVTSTRAHRAYCFGPSGHFATLQAIV